MSEVFIYTLIDPRRPDEVRYVGVTRFPEARERSHRKAGRTHKARWVQSLREAGVQPVLTVVAAVPESEWQESEQFWIAEYRSRGAKLTNGDAGGLNRLRHTDELKAKISATLTGRPNRALSRMIYAYRKADGMLLAAYESGSAAAIAVGGSRPNIVRAVRAGVAASGCFWSYERLERFVPPRYEGGAYQPSPDTRAKLSAASQGKFVGRVFSEETKALMRRSALARHAKARGEPITIEIVQ